MLNEAEYKKAEREFIREMISAKGTLDIVAVLYYAKTGLTYKQLLMNSSIESEATFRRALDVLLKYKIIEKKKSVTSSLKTFAGLRKRKRTVKLYQLNSLGSLFAKQIIEMSKLDFNLKKS